MIVDLERERAIQTAVLPTLDAAKQTAETSQRLEDAARLLYSKTGVNRYNAAKLRALGNPILKPEAQQSCKTAKRAP